jgi:uncharacterized membrane protein YesL
MADPGENQSLLVRALDVFGNLFILNLLFVLTSIPIITIGASLAALYSVTLKMVRREEGAVVKSYFAAWKANFKQATLSWLAVFVVLVIMAGEFLYATNFSGGLSSMYLVVIGIEAAVLVCVIPFLFPLIARYENTFTGTFKNAFLLTVGNLWDTIKIVLLWGVPIGIVALHPGIFYMTWYLWLVVLFALIAWLSSFTIRRVFEKVSGGAENKAEPITGADADVAADSTVEVITESSPDSHSEE